MPTPHPPPNHPHPHTHTPHSPPAAGTVSKRTVNLLRAYALDEAGTQGGLLPVLSELPQLGQVPSCRMYHRSVMGVGLGFGFQG